FASGAADYYGYPDPGYQAPYSGYNEPSQFIGLSAAGKTILRAAFSAWGGATSLTITEAASGTHPDLNVGGSAIPDTAWAYYPGATDSAGDIWFGLDKSFFSKLVSSAGPYIGSYEYATALHEIGHALGLKHPHQGTVKLAAAYDGLEYSVMSYRSYLGGPTSYYTVETWSFPQSLMMLDIAQIQDIYGADFTTQSGNTVYSFDPLTGEMTMSGVSAGVPGANRVFRTIWDGGGTDTIDLSAYATNLDVDLNPGKGIDLDVGGLAQRAQLSSTIYAAHHIYMSLLYNGDIRSLIENASGGSGDDILTGNQAANVLKGGAGNDTLAGGLGADTLTLGSGNDTVADTIAGLDGDKITDFSIQDRLVVRGVSLASAQVSYNTTNGQLRIDSNGDGTSDAVIAIGTKVAGAGLQVSVSGGSSQITFGGTASASPSGPTGSSTGGGSTTTTVTLSAGTDTYAAAAGQAVMVYGLAGKDRITGSSGDDTLYGDADSDTLDGGRGNDILIGGGAKDTLTGGVGSDRFIFTVNDKPASTIG
ncbi:MAG: M10 family metallopeptidase C-terminal domain-containing protein, partial [Mangrovicoccus sp.]|nr:M10 family metallopeptidase C-terminal domain-containing protein [Mangrovicoccus sp.]